jgi:small subunit ribosomal protein S8
MVNDLVSDMLTRIRNASLAKHTFTPVKYSKLNLAILNVLKNEGYIKNYSTEIENNNQEVINLNVKDIDMINKKYKIEFLNKNINFQRILD